MRVQRQRALTPLPRFCRAEIRLRGVEEPETHTQGDAIASSRYQNPHPD